MTPGQLGTLAEASLASFHCLTVTLGTEPMLLSLVLKALAVSPASLSGAILILPPHALPTPNPSMGCLTQSSFSVLFNITSWLKPFLTLQRAELIHLGTHPVLHLSEHYLTLMALTCCQEVEITPEECTHQQTVFSLSLRPSPGWHLQLRGSKARNDCFLSFQDHGFGRRHTAH